MSLVVEGKIFINGIIQDCCIGIKDGKISKIKKILKGDEHLNFKGNLILPAGIDIHVHFRDPGLTNKEDFSSGSTAAAFGGISCVFDMPNTIPQTASIQTVNDKISSASKKSIIDFGVYAGISDDNLDNIDSLSKKCNGFKIYLGSSTNSFKFSKENLRETLQKISNTGKIVLFHAEDENLILKNKGIENGILDHLKYRPSICEETSIKDILFSSKNLNLKTHICHISSIEGLEILKNKSKNISCGVTPHHLLISTEKITDFETFYKVNPPIRTSFDRESLFNAAKNGLVDVIESDHAPHTKEEKDVDFNQAPSGIPGVETMYPLFLFLAKKEVLSYQRMIYLLCKRPAELLGIPKGSIKVGYDADFIVVNFKNDTKIKSVNLHSKCGWSPFEDWWAIFPSSLYIRGEKVIEDNEIVVKRGFGKFVGE
jgi:dihydroorotase